MIMLLERHEKTGKDVVSSVKAQVIMILKVHVK